MKTREAEWDEDEDAGEEIDFFGCLLWVSIINMNVCVWVKLVCVVQNFLRACVCLCNYNESAKNESGGHSSVNYGVNDILCSSGHATWHTQTQKWPSLLRCSHNVADSYGKSLTVRWRANNATHTHKHTRAVAATDKEPHQTGFNEVTSLKENRKRKEGWEEEE